MCFRVRLADWLKDRLVPYVNDTGNVIQSALQDFNSLKRVRKLFLSILVVLQC